MFYIPSSDPTPPMRRLFLVFWIVGMFTVVPALSACVIGLFAVPVLFGGRASKSVVTFLGLGVWQLGNVLWMLLAYYLDARDAERCVRRQPAHAGRRVILRWRNRLLAGAEPSRARRIAWFCLGPGNRIFALAVATALCVVVAYSLATLDDRPNSPGPEPLLAAIVAIIAIALAVTAADRFWARARLARNGQLLTGTVIDAGEEGSHWRIDYRFHTHGDRERTATEYLDYRPARMPSAGDQLAILYEETTGPRIM